LTTDTRTIEEIQTDLITPLGAYLRLREAGPSFLLESVEKGRLGRHSLVGWGSRLVSFEEAEQALGEGGVVVGYLGYDHVATLEPVPLPSDGPPFQESTFIVAEELLRFDHVTGLAEVVVGERDDIAARLEGSIGSVDAPQDGEAGRIRRHPARETYETAVLRVKEYIREGEAYQVVLSQRAARPTPCSAVAIYRSLRRINPSPYLFLLELGGLALIGSSPETLVKLEGRRASLNPIAGTAGIDDGDLERLLASEKDRAEHVMLVDLGRNDLSRVCRPGTVRVERFLQPERYSHVTHLVSEVAGDLQDSVGPFDLLRACFPAGTVSGAPKVRAMQIISELEGYRRGPYAGAVGYALPNGDLDTCIAIRMIALADGVAHLQAGAGIVADSDPRAEHEECLAKLAAMEAAIEEAESP
jgi:anthranilate synthase component 1